MLEAQFSSIMARPILIGLLLINEGILNYRYSVNCLILMLYLELIDKFSQQLIIAVQHLVAITWFLYVKARSCHSGLHKGMMGMIILPVLFPEILNLSHFYVCVYVV